MDQVVSAWCAKPTNDVADIFLKKYGDIVSTQKERHHWLLLD